MLAYFGTGSSLLLETTDECDARDLLGHLSSLNTKTRKHLEYKLCRCAHQQRMGLEHSRSSVVICRINERGQAGDLSHLHQMPGEPEVARDWEHWLSSLAIPFLEMTAVVRIVRTVWLEGRSGHHTHLLKHRPSV